MSTEIKALQQEYAKLSQRVLELYRQSDNPNVRNLQTREEQIVTRLRELGSSPYPTESEDDHLRAARAC